MGDSEKTMRQVIKTMGCYDESDYPIVASPRMAKTDSGHVLRLDLRNNPKYNFRYGGGNARLLLEFSPTSFELPQEEGVCGDLLEPLRGYLLKHLDGIVAGAAP